MRRANDFLLVVVAGVFLLLVQVQPARAQGAPPTSDVAVVCRDIDLTRPMTADELQNAQMCQELSKLREEVASLQAANNATSSGLGFLLPWSGIVTGLAAALGALLVPSIGILVRNSFEKSERRKLEQERALQREQHNLKLMEGLGSGNRAVQLASVSSLLRRIEQIKGQPPREHAGRTEVKTLTDVIVSVLRDPDMDPAVSKFIADEMVNVFDLKIHPGDVAGDGRTPRVSALRDFNLQRARLSGVYWASVYAHGVDFFQADLSRASLRNANLTQAVFYEANLEAAVLSGANLRGANLTLANLKSGNLSGADLTDAIGLDASSFDAKTKWNAETKWPAGFTVPEAPTAVA